MKQFLKDEFSRLVGKLPETDPASPDYHTLLRSIEYLDGMSATIEELLSMDEESEDRVELAEPIPFPKPSIDPADPVPVPAPIEPPVEKEEAEEPTEEPTEAQAEEEEEIVYSASDVRKALVQAKARGADVKEILAMFGVDSFQSLPAAKYGKVMEAIGGA